MDDTHDSPLGEMLRTLKEHTCQSLDKLSVFSANNDRYRQDTPARHRDGAWLKSQIDRLLPGGAPIYLRGLHYVFVTRRVIKPDGRPYQNNAEDWFWMSDGVSRAARWLGYVPFDRIVDERNAPPIIRLASQRVEPKPVIGLANPPDLSDYDLGPAIGLSESESPQLYRLAMFGEKTSLNAVLGPLAEEYNTDLFLAAGEQTISHVYGLARAANEDSRELVVFVFADCDPAGVQMAVSIAHKLRAHKDKHFPDLAYRIYAPALTVEQVGELGLPSTPLKPSERRGDRWRAAFGVEQTEVDALATLNPAELERIARAALDPFFDHTLAGRIEQARDEWWDEASDILNDAARRQPGYAQLRQDAETKLSAAQEALEELERATDLLVSQWDLPEFEMPEAEPSEEGPEPLVSSHMEMLEHIEMLRERIRYGEGDE